MHLDEKVVRRALAGDRGAFQEIVEQVWGIVFVFIQQRIGDRERVIDLTQETFMQAFDKRQTLRKSDSFLSWVLSIASRKIIDQHRWRGAHPEVRLVDGEPPAAADQRDDPLQRAAKAEETERVQAAVQHLPDLYRTVLILRYWSGMTPAQIARLLAEPEGTIRNRIFRAHLQLREHMEDARPSAPVRQEAEPPTARRRERPGR
ncbi:MAG: RNA polymerase sigma factor [Planctomycetota bacterium]